MHDRRMRIRRILAYLGPPVLLASFVLALALPALAMAGLPAGAAADSAGFAFERAHQMSTALIRGHLPPRWMPDAAFGLGYPFWIFHGPLPWMLTALVALFGGGIVGSIKIAWLLLLLASAWGAYRLGERVWRSAAAGLISAAAYLAAPYAISLIYLRPEALSEFALYALAPWLLLAVDALLRAPTAGGIAWLAMLMALAWTSDLAGTAMLLPALFLQALWSRPPSDSSAAADLTPPRPLPLPRTLSAKPGRSLPAAVWRWLLGLELRLWPRRLHPRRAGSLALGAGLLLGLALAAWFLLPALIERSALRPPGEAALLRLESGGFGPLDWLERPADLLALASAPDLPARTGGLQLLLALLGLAVACRSALGAPETEGREAAGRSARLGLAWLGLAALFTLLSTRLALPLYLALRLQPLEWAPWRWLGPQALALALLAGGLAALAASGSSDPSESVDPADRAGRLDRSGRLDRAGLRGWILAALFGLLLIGPGIWRMPRAALVVGEITRENLQVFEVFSGSIGSTSDGAFLPAGAALPPSDGLDVILGHEGNPRALPGQGVLDAATWIRREAASQSWRLALSGSGPARLAFPTYYFPGWSAAVDGARARPAAGIAGSGWLEIEMDPAACSPAARCGVELRLARSRTRALAEGLSLLALCWVLTLLLSDRRPRWGRRLLASVALLPVLVVSARLLPLAAPDGPRILASAGGAYPHYQPAGVRWGQARLAGAALRRQGDSQAAGDSLDLEAGEPMAVSLDWSPAPAGLRAKASLVSPAETQLGLPDHLASAEQDLDAGEPIPLIVPGDAPSGLYFVRLDVSDAEGQGLAARDAAGRLLGEIYLGPLRLRGRSELIELGDAPVQAMGDQSLLKIETELVELDVSEAQDAEPEVPDAASGGSASEGRQSPSQAWLRVALTWRSERAMVDEHAVRLRLVDPRDDSPILEETRLPAYGHLPTTAWPVAAPIVERRWLRLPGDLDLDAEYRLEIQLLDGASGEILGEALQNDLRLR